MPTAPPPSPPGSSLLHLGNLLRSLFAEGNPGAAGCQQQEMLGDVTATEQNRPSRRRERCQEPRQALQVRTLGGGKNVAPPEVSDDRIPVTEHIAARQRPEGSFGHLNTMVAPRRATQSRSSRIYRGVWP
jgi:hypothetical protein